MERMVDDCRIMAIYSKIRKHIYMRQISHHCCDIFISKRSVHPVGYVFRSKKLNNSWRKRPHVSMNMKSDTMILFRLTIKRPSYPIKYVVLILRPVAVMAISQCRSSHIRNWR